MILELNKLKKYAPNIIRLDPKIYPFSPFLPPENPLKGESET